MFDIILVDDESYVTESLAQTIPWDIFDIRNVYQAASAMEALQLLEDHAVDIVVTDIKMPGMNGLELIETIRKRWPQIRCLLLSGHSDFSYAQKAIQLHAVDYILKPVNDEEFMQSIADTIDILKEEWVEAEKHWQLQYSMKSDYSVLRANLMHDLLLGRQLSGRMLQEKLQQYEIALNVGDQMIMLLAQLGKPFVGLDLRSIRLMEYAVGNIAEEVFSGEYRVWHSKSPHDCLIILASPINETNHQMDRDRLEHHVRSLQQHVSHYLKGDITVAYAGVFRFPDEITAVYRKGLSAVFAQEQQNGGTIVFAMDERSTLPAEIKSIDSLYKPPTLIHLLESKQWGAVRQKIEDVFNDVMEAQSSREHLYEVFLSVSNAMMYIAHKNGLFIHQVDQSGFDLLTDQRMVHSAVNLKDWTICMLAKLEDELFSSERYTKSHIIKQVQEIVSSQLGQDISVKMIADCVYMHPVYLSKLFKTEMGESLGDYITRMRMERAHYLLKNTNKKIYEISAEVGYQNPQYFSKMIKKYNNMTPQEFRDS